MSGRVRPTVRTRSRRRGHRLHQARGSLCDPLAWLVETEGGAATTDWVSERSDGNVHYVHEMT
jgi:hypothetical protein